MNNRVPKFDGEYLTFAEALELDLDWWAVDAEKYIGHFASDGSGPIPGKMSVSMHKRLYEYFVLEAQDISNVQESPGWEHHYDYFDCIIKFCL